MRRRSWLVVCLAVLLSSPLWAAQVVPVALHAQWPAPVAGGAFLGAECGGSVNVGTQCVELVASGEVTAIAWQSAVRVGGHAVWSLLWSPTTDPADAVEILTTVQDAGGGTYLTRDVPLPMSLHLEPGYLWVRAVVDGPGDDLVRDAYEVRAFVYLSTETPPQPVGTELQTLRLSGTSVVGGSLARAPEGMRLGPVAVSCGPGKCDTEVLVGGVRVSTFHGKPGQDWYMPTTAPGPVELQFHGEGRVTATWRSPGW